MISLPRIAFKYSHAGIRFRRHLIIALFYFGLPFFFTSCSLQPLTVQTQYLSHENLASYVIGTPDPSLANPPVGERLMIQWSLPSSAWTGAGLYLHLNVRFRTHQEREIKMRIDSKRGYYLYELLNQEYCETGGILTYLVEIRNEECVIASWKHPLWTPLITFETPRE